jgi:hypothetical protein
VRRRVLWPHVQDHGAIYAPVDASLGRLARA